MWAEDYSNNELDQLLDNYQYVLGNKRQTHLFEIRVKVDTEKPISQPAYNIPEVIEEKV